MPRCWPGRCRTCHAACCWTLTNGRQCPVPSISARPHQRSPRRWIRPSAGLPNSAALLGVAAVTNLERKRCGGAFNTSWTSLKCIALCGQSRLYGPNHPKQKNVSNTQGPHRGWVHFITTLPLVRAVITPSPSHHTFDTKNYLTINLSCFNFCFKTLLGDD